MSHQPSQGEGHLRLDDALGNRGGRAGGVAADRAVDAGSTVTGAVRGQLGAQALPSVDDSQPTDFDGHKTQRSSAAAAVRKRAETRSGARRAANVVVVDGAHAADIGRRATHRSPERLANCGWQVQDGLMPSGGVTACLMSVPVPPCGSRRSAACRGSPARAHCKSGSTSE